MLTRRRVFMFVAATLVGCTGATAQRVLPIQGVTGSAAGPNWQASWLDLKPPLAFRKGDRLTIKVIGRAENVLVQLLTVATDDDSPAGIEGGLRKVLSRSGERVVEVVLESDHPNVRRIAVHAGASAWNTSLGANNGDINIVGIALSSN